MCGVAGIYAYHHSASAVDRDELRRIRDHMQRRGPDGYGEWFNADGRVALGHRRLAIIDLSQRAAQPMVSAGGHLSISFNGEIYNYRELRGELQAQGVIFQTESDTEVLLQLYARKGVDMLADLRGMFAFAIWDGRKRGMLLARDPYGIKPLYVADDGWTLRFASQVKALLAGGRVSRAVEPAGVTGFFLFGSVPEPWTTYEAIQSLPAGTYQWVDAVGPREPVTYFSLASVWASAARQRDAGPGEVSSIARDALRDTVSAHLVADVPVGAFLSSGVDSGALVGLMAETHGSGEKIRACTLSFDEHLGTLDDEAPLASEIAALYGVDHRVSIVSETQFQQELPRLLDAMDQPTIDGINTWFVSKVAADMGLKVAVSGLGGDELLGGYPSFRDIPRWVRTLRGPSLLPLIGEAFGIALRGFRLGNPKAAGLLKYGGDYAGAYLLRRGVFLPEELSRLLGEDLAREGLSRLRPLRYISSYLRGVPSSAHARVSVLESALYMRNQLLRDTDWASMAHSLEVRVPLVDAWLVRALAPYLPVRAGHPKQWLAESPSTALPERIANRSKTGFSTPISRWQQRDAIARSWRGLDILESDRCPWARRWAWVVHSEASLAAADG